MAVGVIFFSFRRNIKKLMDGAVRDSMINFLFGVLLFAPDYLKGGKSLRTYSVVTYFFLFLLSGTKCVP